MTISNLEKRGVFTPYLDKLGVRRINPQELDRYQRNLIYKVQTQNPLYARKTPGDVAAAAFIMLDDGATRRDLVMQLRITPQRALDLWRAWSTPGWEEAANDVDREKAAAERRARMERIHKLLRGVNQRDH